jgi:dolichyl-phosphate beta-glucosyltransferase
VSPSCTVVVPCYNEGDRLEPSRLEALADLADARVLAVDDGSTDDTGGLLGKLADPDPDRFGLVSLTENCGKGEAVRQGLLAAVEEGADLVAYCDADFAAPPGEVARLVTELRAHDGVDVVIGSRVALLGADIRRSPLRHYSGRLFATVGSLVLGVPVYDTQCGAKAFRVTPRLRAAIDRPFVSRWAFDVELLGRLLDEQANGRSPAQGSGGPGAAAFVEVPLHSWDDHGGSKLTAGGAARAGLDLIRIWRRMRRARGRRASTPSADRLDEERDGT